MVTTEARDRPAIAEFKARMVRVIESLCDASPLTAEAAVDEILDILTERTPLSDADLTAVRDYWLLVQGPRIGRRLR